MNSKFDGMTGGQIIMQRLGDANLSFKDFLAWAQHNDYMFASMTSTIYWLTPGAQMNLAARIDEAIEWIRNNPNSVAAHKEQIDASS
jgi:hypothetical protein